MKHIVFITGPHKGKTALRNKYGAYQMDGPKDFWKKSDHYRKHPLCFNWHKLEGEWKENNK